MAQCIRCRNLVRSFERPNCARTMLSVCSRGTTGANESEPSRIMPQQRETEGRENNEDETSSSGTSDYEDWDPTNPAHAKVDPEPSDQKESNGPSNLSGGQATSNEPGHGGGGPADQAVTDLAESSGMPLSQEESDRMLKAADKMKLEGNQLFGEGKFAEAAAKYKEAIAAG